MGLFCRNIVYICFGEDISDTEIEIEYPVDAQGSSYEKKKFGFSEAMRMV